MESLTRSFVELRLDEKYLLQRTKQERLKERQRKMYDRPYQEKLKHKRRMQLAELALLEETMFALLARKMLEQSQNPVVYCLNESRSGPDGQLNVLDVIKSSTASWERMTAIRSTKDSDPVLSPRYELYQQLSHLVEELDAQNSSKL